LSKDHKKIAALAMLAKGQATLSEAARLAGTSRQRVAFWSRHLDIKAARDRWLARQWAIQLAKLEAKNGGKAKR
jgi:hypothetical protein